MCTLLVFRTKVFGISWTLVVELPVGDLTLTVLVATIDALRHFETG